MSRLRPGGAAAPAAALAATLATLAACSSLRTAPTEHAPEPPPLENSESAAPAPVTAEPPPPSASADSTPSETANAAAAPCVPPETKPKPKPRPKPKPVRREAPPQLPTSPSVAETPAGGVVNAQVKLMPVAVMSILGKPVKGPNGEDLGRVVDVLADASGRVRIAIVDFGGFLGVGDRRIAVDWPLLRFNPDGGDSSLLLSVGRDKLKSAPEYKGTPRPETLMEPESAAAPQAAAVSAAPSVPADKKN